MYGQRGEVVLILKYIYLIYIRKYLIVGSKFNDRVALIWKYIYMGIYIWKYLACNLEPRFSFLHI